MVLYKDLCQNLELSSYLLDINIVNIEILWLNYNFRPISYKLKRAETK